MAAPATGRLMKIRQKKPVEYLHLPVYTYSCMVGRRLEMEQEATNEIIHGSRVKSEFAGMRTSTEVWGPG